MLLFMVNFQDLVRTYTENDFYHEYILPRLFSIDIILRSYWVSLNTSICLLDLILQYF